MLRDARLYPADRSCFQYIRLLFLRVSFVIRSDREKGRRTVRAPPRCGGHVAEKQPPSEVVGTGLGGGREPLYE